MSSVKIFHLTAFTNPIHPHSFHYLSVINVKIFSFSVFESVSPFSFVSILVCGSHHTSAVLFIITPFSLVNRTVLIVHSSPTAPFTHVPTSFVVTILVIHRSFAMFLTIFPVSGVNFLVLIIHLINQHAQITEPVLLSTFP